MVGIEATPPIVCAVTSIDALHNSIVVMRSVPEAVATGSVHVNPVLCETWDRVATAPRTDLTINLPSDIEVVLSATIILKAYLEGPTLRLSGSPMRLHKEAR